MNVTRRQSLKIALIALAVPMAATMAQADGHAKRHVVEIKGFAFVPSELTINAGDTVEFVNADGAPHTATADNKAFDTGRLGKGDAKALRFSKTGSYDYFCEVHPRMRAKIVVK